MQFNYKNIHIGNLIKLVVEEKDISIERICNFFKMEEDKLNTIYQSEKIDCIELLRWSKLLEYDFFRIYSQHLLLYSPPSSVKYNKQSNEKSNTPQFKKNLYTIEIIEFIVGLIENGNMKSSEIITRYNIPKTTLYKWIKKHKKYKKVQTIN